MFITLPYSRKRSYIIMKIPVILNLTSQIRFLDAQYSWWTISIFSCCVYFLFQGVGISQFFLGKGFKPDQKSLFSIHPRPRMIASEWVFRYLEMYFLFPCLQKILAFEHLLFVDMVLCWLLTWWPDSTLISEVIMRLTMAGPHGTSSKTGSRLNKETL